MQIMVSVPFIEVHYRVGSLELIMKMQAFAIYVHYREGSLEDPKTIA